MASLIEAYHNIQKWIDNNKIKELDNLFLIDSPVYAILISILYLWFVKKGGPKLMENRRPFQLKNAMLIYNALQVIINAYIVFRLTVVFIVNPIYSDWGCMSFTPDKAGEEVYLHYSYYLVKIIDYTDTIFMVLRKRYNQITVLHVYHHILMVLSTFGTARFVGGGQVIMLGHINCFVHAVMYGYYFIAALDPQTKNSAWWKKHITHLQMTQFVFLFIHFMRPLFRDDCNQSPGLMIFAALQNVTMIFMFGNFYVRTYIMKPKRKSA